MVRLIIPSWRGFLPPLATDNTLFLLLAATDNTLLEVLQNICSRDRPRGSEGRNFGQVGGELFV